MNERAHETLPLQTDETLLYAELFSRSLDEMQKFLDVLFTSIFQSWGAFALVGRNGKGEFRIFEDHKIFAPLCTEINDLGLRDRCTECDRRRAHEVSTKIRSKAGKCPSRLGWIVGLRSVAGASFF